MMLNGTRTARATAAAAALIVSLVAMPAHANDALAAIVSVLEASQRESRGVTLYVNGQTIGGGVVKIEGTAWVELRNRQFPRIVVRIDRIDAAALN